MADKTPGEIEMKASRDGREIVLDPPLRFHHLTVRMREVESTIPCGLRQQWASGEFPQEMSGFPAGTKFDLLCGAGCGSPWLMIHIGEREFCIHARDILDGILDALDPANVPSEPSDKETPADE